MEREKKELKSDFNSFFFRLFVLLGKRFGSVFFITSAIKGFVKVV